MDNLVSLVVHLAFDGLGTGDNPKRKIALVAANTNEGACAAFEQLAVGGAGSEGAGSGEGPCRRP